MATDGIEMLKDHAEDKNEESYKCDKNTLDTDLKVDFKNNSLFINCSNDVIKSEPAECPEFENVKVEEDYDIDKLKNETGNEHLESENFEKNIDKLDIFPGKNEIEQCNSKSKGHSGHHCPECSLKTNNKTTLRKHMLKHTPQHLKKWFYCVQCPFKCSRKGLLRKHISSVHEEPPIECTKCEFIAETTQLLKSHLITKHRLKDFKLCSCDHCPYKADSDTDLQKHILSKHNKTKNYKWLRCDHCSHKAKSKMDLKKHMSSDHHSTLREFKCNLCEMSFAQRNSLTRHIDSRHTPDHLKKWYPCGHCSKKLRSKLSLQGHIFAIHSSYASGNRRARNVTVSDFKCDICELYFTVKDSLKKHNRCKHNPS